MVVHEEHLPLARQFLPHGALDDLFAERHDHRVDGAAAAGRRCHDGAIAQTAERHLQRARNGRGGEDEHVGLHAQALDALLVSDPETVFFIHHQQAQVLEADVLLQQAVGADDNIHRSILQSLQRAGLLLAAVQSAQHGDPRAERLEAALESLGVLLRQHRGGHQHGHLLAVEYRLESGAQGNLGLAVADVAAHQPFHGPRAFHVAQHVLDGLHLVVGLDVLEGVFKLLVQRRGRRKAVADVLLARGVQAD